MKYELKETDHQDIHRFTLDSDNWIDVLYNRKNGSVYYDVCKNGNRFKGLPHEQIILRFWQNENEGEFQHTLRKALDLGVELMEE